MLASASTALLKPIEIAAGASKPFGAVHVSDTHIVRADATEKDPRKHHKKILQRKRDQWDRDLDKGSHPDQCGKDPAHYKLFYRVILHPPPDPSLYRSRRS